MNNQIIRLVDELTKQNLLDVMERLEYLGSKEEKGSEVFKRILHDYDIMSEAFAYFATSEELEELSYRDIPKAFLENAVNV